MLANLATAAVIFLGPAAWGAAVAHATDRLAGWSDDRRAPRRWWRESAGVGVGWWGMIAVTAGIVVLPVVTLAGELIRRFLPQSGGWDEAGHVLEGIFALFALHGNATLWARALIPPTDRPGWRTLLACWLAAAAWLAGTAAGLGAVGWLAWGR